MSYVAAGAGIVLIYVGLKILNGPPMFDEDTSKPSKFEMGKPHYRDPDPNTNYIGMHPHEHGENDLAHNYQPLRDRDGRIKYFINDGGVEGLNIDKGDMRALRVRALVPKPQVGRDPNDTMESRIHVYHQQQTKTPTHNRNHVLQKVHTDKLFKRMAIRKWDI